MLATGSIPSSFRLKTPLPPSSSFKASGDGAKASSKVAAFRPSSSPSEPHHPPSSPKDNYSMPLKSLRATNRELIALEPWSTDDIDMEVSLMHPSPSGSLPPNSDSSSSLGSSPYSPRPRPGELAVNQVTASAGRPHKPPSDRNAWSGHGNGSADPAMASMAHMMRGAAPPSSEEDLLPLWERPPHVVLDSSPQKMDAEMKIFHDAFAQRRQTVRAATAPSPPRKVASLLTQYGAASRPEPSPARPKTTQTVSSVLRVHQMGEIEEIRLAFERHNLSFHNQVFERALLIPEDKTTAECVANLPLPGSRLPNNPHVTQKVLLFKTLSTSGKKKAKKAKKKSKKKGKKKTKS